MAESKSEGKFDFVLYPNPVQNTLSVSFESTVEANYAIINMMGQQVKSGRVAQEGIEVNELNSGVYFIQVTDGQNTITKKFLKQ